MEIRHASAEDFPQIKELYGYANQYHSDLLPEQVKRLDPAIDRSWFKEQLQNPLKSFHIALRGQIPLGMIALEIRDQEHEVFQRTRHLFIEELVVSPEHRGKGVGDELMEFARKKAVEENCSEIRLNVWEDNKMARLFYEKLGYSTLRRELRMKIESG